MRQLVVGALLSGATLFAGGAAAHAFDDGGSYSASSTDSGGGYDTGGYSDSGGFADSGGYSDAGGSYDTGGYDTGSSDVGSYDSGYSDVGSYDSGYSDVGAVDTGFADAGYAEANSYDAGYSDVGGYDTGYSDVGAVDTGFADTGYAEASSSDTGYAEPVATTEYAEPVSVTETVAPAEPTTTVTAIDEVTSETGYETGAADGTTIAGTPTDHVDPIEGLTDDPSGTYTTTHQVGTETETVAPTTVDGWFSHPETATSTTTTFEGTETVQETGIPSIGTDGAVNGSVEESMDHLDVSETTTTVAPTDGEGWTTTQVDRTEYGPGWGLDLDPTDGTLEGSVTYQGEISSSYDAGQDFGATSVATGYDLTAGADATAEATLDLDSVGIDLGVEGTASAAGHVGATFGEDTFAETEITATGTLEGEVQAGIEADLGLTQGSADVGLFGGVSASGELEGEIAGITGTVGVTGSVGAGVGAGFDYSAENGVYSLSGHVHGAAVIGGGVSGGITVDTNELAESVSQAWDSFTSTVSGWFGGKD
ncbi:MAG TPA: hypothetical protein VF228_09570 [Iamia sp.]